MATTVTVTRAAYGDKFTGNDGKEVQEYELEFESPIEGVKIGYCYGEAGAALVQKAQQGPIEITYEKKNNKYKGDYLKVRDAADKNSYRGRGGRGTTPEYIALEMTKLAFAGEKVDNLESVVETFNFFKERVQA